MEVDEIQTLDSVVLSYQEGSDFWEQRAFWVRDHIGAVSLQKGRLTEEPCLAAAGTADDQNVLVPGILGIFRPACHGDALCLCHGDILEEIRVHIGGYVCGCAPSGTAIFHAVPVLLLILPPNRHSQPQEHPRGNAPEDIHRLDAGQRIGKGSRKALR